MTFCWRSGPEFTPRTKPRTSSRTGSSGAPRHAARERPSWHAEVPLQARFPKLGGHSPVFEALCDHLAQRLGGAERTIISGRGHTIPATGDAYNNCLRGFLSRAEQMGAPGHNL